MQIKINKLPNACGNYMVTYFEDGHHHVDAHRSYLSALWFVALKSDDKAVRIFNGEKFEIYEF